MDRSKLQQTLMSASRGPLLAALLLVLLIGGMVAFAWAADSKSTSKSGSSSNTSTKPASTPTGKSSGKSGAGGSSGKSLDNGPQVKHRETIQQMPVIQAREPVKPRE